MLSALQARDMVKTVTEAHPAGITFYPISNEPKDKPTEPDYPFLATALPDTQTDRTSLGIYLTSFDFSCIVVGQTASARTPDQLDGTHSTAHGYAMDIALELGSHYPNDIEVSRIRTTPIIDEGTGYETGVLLRFRMTDTAPLCSSTEFTYG